MTTTAHEDQFTPAPVEVTQDEDPMVRDVTAWLAANPPAPPADLVELVEALRALRNRAEDVADSLNTSLMDEAITAADAVLAKHTRTQGEA